MLAEYEIDRPPENCENCEHYEFDCWYPGERVCVNKYGPRYDESVDKYDRCDWWERRRE